MKGDAGCPGLSSRFLHKQSQPGPRGEAKGIRPKDKWGLNYRQNFGPALWTGVICHRGRLADQRGTAQLAGGWREVCPRA